MSNIVAARKAYARINELNKVSVGPGAETAANAAGVMTGTTVLTGDRVLASGAISSLCFQRKWTGTPTGTFTYEGSNDEDPDANPQVGWVAVTPDTAGANPAGGASGNVTLFKNPPMRWYHEIYTNSGGAGVLISIAEGKGA